MDHVRLGNTGLKVSRLCLGCMTYGSSKWRPWVLDEEAALPFFKKALEAGVNFFDTADVYSAGESERVTGKALKEFAKRHEVVIATKVHGPMGADANNRGLSRKHIFDAIDRSLARLGVDYVDLYQIHRFDPETPIEETLEALHDVVRAGKARYIGASSDVRLAVHEDARRLARPRLDALRLHAAAVQPGLSRGGARDAAAVPRPGDRASSRGRRWRAASWPAAGPAPARATPSAPAPTNSPRASTTASPTSPWSRPWRRSPRPAASPTCRSPWPG